MKKLLPIVCIAVALTSVVQAQDSAPKKKREVSPELKSIIDKYDTNKDGKLDKEERAKMSEADKAKMKELAPRREKQEAGLKKKESEAK